MATRISTFSADFPDLGRDFRPAATGFLYPFRLIFAVWVEISGGRELESLPFSVDFPDLGRDFQPAALGFSTFSAVFPPIWVEISGRRLWDSLPFRLIFAVWVEIFDFRHKKFTTK